MKKRLQRPLFLLALLFVLAACGQSATVSEEDKTPALPTEAPTTIPEADEPVSDLPTAVEYNLGETTIVQSQFSEDSRFRNMPVRLNGIIAVPAGDGGPYPVVVIFHGTHPGCPVDETEVDRWPCDPEVEQPNYRGFAYLAEALAAQGYVTLAPNLNAENTFGFGEPQPGERLLQIVELQLDALAEAVAGGPNGFGVALAGRADLSRMAIFGHSRGGEAASWLANTRGLAAPDAAEKFGYGPVKGLLLLAPAPIFTVPAASSVPQAVILPACDGDVMLQDGQLFYEGARLDPTQEAWALSVWLEQANHNYFNSTLGSDIFAIVNRADCETLLTPETQRQFLVDFATTFLTTIFSDDPQAVDGALAALGMDPAALAPDSLFGLPARVMTLAPAAARRPLLIPAGAEELTTNLAGGEVVADGVNLFYCEAGYFTPSVRPGSEPCKRANVTIPGNPAMVVTSWERSGAILSLALPEGAGDLSDYTTISLRAAVDPMSELNAAGTPQAFSVRLTDRSGASATVRTRPGEPALTFPVGIVTEDDVFEDGLFSGRVPMTTIRLLLSDFSGVDLSQISQITLLFDQTDSGALFLGDLELVRE